jgi:hypothetical protein
MLTRTLAVVVIVLFAASCAPEPVVSNEAPAGTWSGDYEIGAGRRESINVELRWEDASLRGTVHSGFRALPITKASFDRETGAITIEFDAEGGGGRTVHYVVDGKVTGDTMSGTWTHDNQRGGFRVTKE